MPKEKLVEVDLVGGGPLDGKVLAVSATTAAIERWFVDDDGVARRGVYQLDRATAPAVMRWQGPAEDAPLQDPVQMLIKVPGFREPITVAYEREIAEWFTTFDESDARVAQGPGSEWFLHQVRSQVIAAVAAFSSMSGYDGTLPGAEILLRAQMAREARDGIIPGTYIAQLALFANKVSRETSRTLRAAAVDYLRGHPMHAHRLRSPEFLKAMGPMRRWVEGVLHEAARP